MSVKLSAVFVVFVVPLLCSCEDDGCPTCPPYEKPAPAGWFQQASPTQERLLRIDAIDASTAVAVGRAGTIVRTSDGGATWTVVPSPTTEDLLTVFFVDGAAVWIAGMNSTLLKSTDAGGTWTPVSIPVPTDLRAIQFVSADRGYTSGGPGQGVTGERVFYATTDGGETWQPQTMEYSMNGIAFVDADSGCVIGGGAVWKTTDGAQTWTRYEARPPEVTAWLADIVFVDALEGWVSGSQGFLTKTTDGGRTWTEISSGTTRVIPEIDFLDADHGAYVGRPTGTIAVTTDGGANWEFQTSSTTLSLYDVHFFDRDVGWVVGEEGTILKTTTGGF
jgi:photosystem II stability/assembly factor-like uncharacterized protein